jgi:hypothetical protein
MNPSDIFTVRRLPCQRLSSRAFFANHAQITPTNSVSGQSYDFHL